MTLSQSRCRNTGDALAYMTECTLATVDRLIMAKNPPIGELLRQISIAQVGINLLFDFDIEIPKNGRLFSIASTSRDVVDYADRLRAELYPGKPLKLR